MEGLDLADAPVEDFPLVHLAAAVAGLRTGSLQGADDMLAMQPAQANVVLNAGSPLDVRLLMIQLIHATLTPRDDPFPDKIICDFCLAFIARRFLQLAQSLAAAFKAGIGNGVPQTDELFDPQRVLLLQYTLDVLARIVHNTAGARDLHGAKREGWVALFADAVDIAPKLSAPVAGSSSSEPAPTLASSALDMVLKSMARVPWLRVCEWVEEGLLDVLVRAADPDLAFSSCAETVAADDEEAAARVGKHIRSAIGIFGWARKRSRRARERQPGSTSALRVESALSASASPLLVRTLQALVRARERRIAVSAQHVDDILRGCAEACALGASPQLRAQPQLLQRSIDMTRSVWESREGGSDARRCARSVHEHFVAVQRGALSDGETLEELSALCALPAAKDARSGLMREEKVFCTACSRVIGGDTGVRLMLCGRCKLVVYCGAQCQGAAWKEHKAPCAAYCARLKSDGGDASR